MSSFAAAAGLASSALIAGALVSGALVSEALVSEAMAQTDFPNKRIQVVLPYPAGGIVDIVTRITTDKLANTWGQPIVVESRLGANGNIAWDFVSRADPDGYTWGFIAPALVANPRMQPSVKWNEDSFVPIGGAVWAPSIVVVHPSVPAKTVAEFVAYAKSKPGILNWANPGIGTSQHLNTAIFNTTTKVEMVPVIYRGQPAAILDLLSNRVQFMIASPGLVVEHITAGTLKPLAILGTQRAPQLLEVPTMTEAGFSEINVVAWYGYSAPRGTPQPIVDKIVSGFNGALQDPAVRSALEKQYLQVMEPLTPSALRALLASDAEKYAKVIRDANIRIGD